MGMTWNGSVGSDCHEEVPPPPVHVGWARVAMSHRRSPAKGASMHVRAGHCSACMLMVRGWSASHCTGAISTWVGPCEAAICCEERLVRLPPAAAHLPRSKHTCESMPLQCKHAHAHCMERILLYRSDLHAAGLTGGNQEAVRGVRQAAASAHAASSLEEAKGLL